jgi:hypothetical protein
MQVQFNMQKISVLVPVERSKIHLLALAFAVLRVELAIALILAPDRIVVSRVACYG